MLEKREVIDLIQILEDGTIQVRSRISVLEDGIELSYAYHRHCVVPGTSLDEEDSRVKDIGNLVHTEDVVSAYADKIKDIDSEVPQK